MTHERPVKPSLRGAGLKATHPREILLKVLENAEVPLTVDEIIQRLGAPRSGRPTIYRNLELFVQVGWVESFVDEQQVKRFMKCLARGHHHHIHCERCQRTSALASCDLQSVLDRFRDQSGYLVTRHEFQVFGLCPQCQKGVVEGPYLRDLQIK